MFQFQMSFLISFLLFLFSSNLVEKKKERVHMGTAATTLINCSNLNFRIMLDTFSATIYSSFTAI